MGFFGGGSKSKTISNQTTTTYNQAADGANNGVMVSGSNNAVTYTDDDAIAQSFKASQAALDDAMSFGNNALDKVSSGFNTNLQAMASLQARQTNTQAQEMTLMKQLAASQQSGGTSDLLSTIQHLGIVIAVMIGIAVIVMMWRQ